MKPLPAWQARWARFNPRERNMVLLGGTVVVLALLWWVVLGPALNTLRQAAQQHQRLDTQLDHMRRLQAQAQALLQRPRTQGADAARTLDSSVRQQLGAAAQLQINGAQATVTLKSVPAQVLAQWLAQTRLETQATVAQARLKRDAAAGPASWSGTLVLSLPAS